MSTRGWQDVTHADILRMQHKSTPPPTKSKYRNVKAMADGFQFDSQHEADTWMMLRSREKAGDISELRRQVAFPLFVPVIGADGKPTGVICECAAYIADFVFLDKAGNRVVMDAKGQKKRICPYPLKAKMMNLTYGVTIVEV